MSTCATHVRTMEKPSSGWICPWPHINACTHACIDTNQTPIPRANTSWPLRNSLRLTTQQTPYCYSACPTLQPHHLWPTLARRMPTHSSTPSSQRVIAISQRPGHRFDRRMAAGLSGALLTLFHRPRATAPTTSDCCVHCTPNNTLDK